MPTVTKTVFKVGDFVSWAQAQRLDLHPVFQRRPVWKKGAKSYLIDTIVRNLPIPIVFLRDKLAVGSITTTREVIDGQQRLRTILGFIDPNLVGDYNQDIDYFRVNRIHNPELADKSFDQLAAEFQQAIVGYEIPVHVFSSDTEDRDVLQIFARMNATGVKLNAQELRNANFFGAFKSLCYKIAYENLSRWRQWDIFTLGNISRMAEVEEVSDLIISMHEGVHGKNAKILDKYYEKYDDEYKEAGEVERRFEAVMGGIEDSFGTRIRASEFSRLSLFNSLFVATYGLMFGFKSDLSKPLKPARLPNNFGAVLHELSERIKKGDIDEDLRQSLRGATAHSGTRQMRLDFILGAFDYGVAKS